MYLRHSLFHLEPRAILRHRHLSSIMARRSTSTSDTAPPADHTSASNFTHGLTGVNIPMNVVFT